MYVSQNNSMKTTRSEIITEKDTVSKSRTFKCMRQIRPVQTSFFRRTGSKNEEELLTTTWSIMDITTKKDLVRFKKTYPEDIVGRHSNWARPGCIGTNLLTKTS